MQTDYEIDEQTYRQTGRQIDRIHCLQNELYKKPEL